MKFAREKQREKSALHNQQLSMEQQQPASLKLKHTL